MFERNVGLQLFEGNIESEHIHFLGTEQAQPRTLSPSTQSRTPGVCPANAGRLEPNKNVIISKVPKNSWFRFNRFM